MKLCQVMRSYFERFPRIRPPSAPSVFRSFSGRVISYIRRAKTQMFLFFLLSVLPSILFLIFRFPRLFYIYRSFLVPFPAFHFFAAFPSPLRSLSLYLRSFLVFAFPYRCKLVQSITIFWYTLPRLPLSSSAFRVHRSIHIKNSP